MKAVEAENLIFSYVSPESKSKSLSDVSVEIEKGEFIAVLGKNGSGKTTLARHFNALLSVQAESWLLQHLMLPIKAMYGK